VAKEVVPGWVRYGLIVVVLAAILYVLLT